MTNLANGSLDGECRGDLLARERRGTLSSSDCLALRAHLAACSSCRIARWVFVDLDDVSGVDLRDGVRIERMSNAARRWAHHRNRPAPRVWKGRPRLRTLGLAACALLICATASATVWFWRSPDTLPFFAIRSAVVPPQIHAPASPWRKVDASDRPSPELMSEPTVKAPNGQLNRSPSRRAMRSAEDEAGMTPAGLLRRASDARRAGDTDRAARLYRKLQRTFPHSSESLLSSVAIGGILLAQNTPRAALIQFDSYLMSSGGGALIPEALYGRGRALAALGDGQEERRTWERLLGDFPESAYAPLARRRLADLK